MFLKYRGEEFIRVRPIPGMIPIPGTDTRYRYLYEKNQYESVSVSVRYGGYLGISVSVYRYDTDFLMQYLYIGIKQIYRYHTDISVSVWCGDFGDIGLNILLTDTDISVHLISESSNSQSCFKI